MKIWSLLRTGSARRSGAGVDPRLRILAWATIAGLIFGAVEFGKPVEDVLRYARAQIRQHPASGDIVVVGIDEASLQTVDRQWPWSRRHHARMVDELNRLGARRIFFDVRFYGRKDAAGDLAFADALARSKAPVTLASTSPEDVSTGKRIDVVPPAIFRRHVELANINVRGDYREIVQRLHMACCNPARPIPTLAARLGGASGSGETFPIDYAIDLRTIPFISAAEVLRGAGPSGSLRGKDVVVAPAAVRLDDNYILPLYGRQPGVYVQVLGGETLKKGVPISIGWTSFFLLALLVSILCGRTERPRVVAVVGVAGMAGMFGLALLLENRHVWAEIVPGMFLLLVTSVALIWRAARRKYQARGKVNGVSGLANLQALRAREADGGRILIAARIGNYPQIASTLPPGSEPELVEQIANRLTLGSSGPELFHGDEGIFAWFSDMPDVAAVGGHLDALHGFFRNSVTVAGKPIDLTLSFGVDAGGDHPSGDRAIGNRLGSALVACDEAAAEGRRWKAFDPAALDDAAWRLSLLGQLDRAIDTGDFWVAYQPKLDLRTGRIVGAEALARWTHPEKGAIAPVDFILAAEQNDRIEKLTRFVLDKAIGAAAAIGRNGAPFDIAVNVSTRLIGDVGLAMLVETLLRHHGLAPGRLTVEITETAALDSGRDHFATLARLRKLGVRISIDDYGTGMSTLEYLKKIPASEIKIDQSFVGSVTTNYRDRLMVNSTVQLAHSLGRVVVAEGVEDQGTLDALTAMGCDLAQGFFIGRPMDLTALIETIGKEPKCKLINFS